MDNVLLGLGANVSGRWGPPKRTLAEAVRVLAAADIMTKARSSIYVTAPLGNTRQPDYLNAVISVSTNLLPRPLLRQLKRIEKSAGRGLGLGRWGARPLDIDILDYPGHLVGWPPVPRPVAPLILPHAELHRRIFVLAPLFEVAPHWRHRVLGLPAKTLIQLLPRRNGIERLADTKDW